MEALDAGFGWERKVPRVGLSGSLRTSPLNLPCIYNSLTPIGPFDV